ncbi:class I SAM-dependent methyltransferase [Anaerobacillus alkaliphilus]|uniref:Class I SAM-dependent methyltransferase n=1 Tax=Anaerobacillus alkaliphilus TaxID=1548597 RepID=A0A4V1LFV6_9BACI|nr:class I SAM-dependent methyltransferase [Anaerobacillus alkaliphilus]RXI96619.1 class I SAM-dependent methyltransferase [Anaerobacillus alkaliphilus]
MGIDFQDKRNRYTYSARGADRSWMQKIEQLVPIGNFKNAVDIGCGGGIYTKALVDMGVAAVTGIDSSEVILDGARENCQEYKNISFRLGDASHTGLESSSIDLILERALIHHLNDLKQCFLEAYRLLEDEGAILIQDRTPEDCLFSGSEQHIRGYFFECFPRLAEVEVRRRFNSEEVLTALKETGFKNIKEVTFWETRKCYQTKVELVKDLRLRTGRSILHELDNDELRSLVTFIESKIVTDGPIIEKDRWTIWIAEK